MTSSTIPMSLLVLFRGRKYLYCKISPVGPLSVYFVKVTVIPFQVLVLLPPPPDVLLPHDKICLRVPSAEILHCKLGSQLSLLHSTSRHLPPSGVRSSVRSRFRDSFLRPPSVTPTSLTSLSPPLLQPFVPTPGE